MSYTSPLSLFIEDLSVKMESDMENAVMKVALKVNATADKFELWRALEYDRGQYEAAMALGVRYAGMMKDIILPQAIKSVLPSLVNEFISLLKNTTLIASIGLVDILRVGQLIQSRTYRAFEPFFAISVFYYLLVMGLSFLGKLLERWVNKSDRR